MKIIVVASDSFKGCLTSMQVADAVEEGINESMPGCVVRKVAVADGGEGTIDALLDSKGGQRIICVVQDPLGRPVEAEYAILDGGTAVIEMSKASGLTLLSPEERNPLLTSTYGTGQLIADAISHGCRKVLVCLGGSATNDAGIGMLTALGWRFYDKDGQILEGCGASLSKVSRIDASDLVDGIEHVQFTIACDVDSPLYGPSGAAYVFASQKGADAAMVLDLDQGLKNFSSHISRYAGVDVASIPGAGAAGGLGAAFMAFLNAEIKKGAEMVLEAVLFDDMIKDADMIITGEGRIDSQTLSGKLPSEVARHAARNGIPVVAICGTSEVQSLPIFAQILPITPPDMPLKQAMTPKTASQNIISAISTTLK